MSLAVAVLVAVLAAAPTAPAPTRGQEDAAPQAVRPDALDERVGAIHAELLEEALVLARRADEGELHSAAAQLFELVVTLEPDHEEARKALGQRKRRGEWQQRSKKVEPDRASDDFVQRIAAARMEAADRFEDALDDAFAPYFVERSSLDDDAEFEDGLDDVFLPDEEERDVETYLPPAHAHRLRVALAPVVLLDPDDGPRRERTWWSYDDEARAWVMREVLETRRHVLEARAALATIRAGLPTTRDCDVDDDSAATGFVFGARVGSDLLSVVSTGGAAEARQIHDQVLATRLWLPLAFGGETSHWPASVVVIEDPDRRLEFFSRHPGVPEGGAAALAELGSCWIDGRLFVSRYDTAQRVDGAVFQTVGAYLRKVYGIDQRHGWLNQSLCNYLTAKVYGTHLSFWVTTDRYGSSKGLDWTERAPLSAGGWFELALPLLADDRPIASFARVLTFPTQQMTWEDVVVGYAFSAYLFEGRRDDLLEIAGRFGGREEKTAVVEDVLEMPLDAVRERLRAWIVAMRTVQR